MTEIRTRRRDVLLGLGAVGALLLSGCDHVAQSPTVVTALGNVEGLNRRLHRWLTGRFSMAQEFAETDRSPWFRSNGTSVPRNDFYQAMVAGGFRDYQLQVSGLVERPLRLTLDDLRAAPSRTQITRHDCVEGWSAIAKWKGARLNELLDRAGVRPEARYVMFYCADPMEDTADSEYYESIDLEEARHPQTLLAYELNDRPLPVANGAPIRLRVERQLGYKHAKYVMRIDLVESFAGIRGGKGGYWEDQGYEWYAGI